MLTQERIDDGMSQARADISLLDYHADSEDARYPHNPGVSSGFRYQDLLVSDHYRPKLQVVRPKNEKADLQRGAPVGTGLLSANNAAKQLAEVLSDDVGYFPQIALEQIVRTVLQHLLASGATLPQLDSSQQATASVQQSKPSKTPADLGLTRRETEVLRILAEGKSNKEISRALNMAIGTVKVHVKAVCEKLKVSRRAEVIVAVNRLGLAI